MKPDCSDYLPLSPATMHVLLALTNGDLHGYGILLEVARQSQGAYKIGPGTLYDNLKKLLGEGLVEEADSQGERTRREYRLTKLGAAVLRAETERLGKVVKEARKRLGPVEERAHERPSELLALAAAVTSALVPGAVWRGDAARL